MCACGAYRINKSYFMFHTGNHTVAVIKGHESYDLLKTSCNDVFVYVNKLIDDGKISIDGKDIQVEILLGGDYKVYHVTVIIENYYFAQVMGGGHIKKKTLQVNSLLWQQWS